MTPARRAEIVREAEEVARKVTAPAWAAIARLDHALAGLTITVNRHAAQIAAIEDCRLAYLIYPPPGECRACGETIEPERRTVQ